MKNESIASTHSFTVTFELLAANSSASSPVRGRCAVRSAAHLGRRE